MIEHTGAAAQLRMLMSEHNYTPDQIAETAIQTLYPALSEGAANTYERLGRGAVLMDLRELAEGKLNTSYVPLHMLDQISAASDVFAGAVAAASAYEPERQFVCVIWLAELVTVFRLQRI
ncbi:MAG: hypothetical protein H7Z42_23660 [Roseiflexaceae bacterium]|nr:hypothetical protein [Roseiflexaceae bacterium]